MAVDRKTKCLCHYKDSPPAFLMHVRGPALLVKFFHFGSSLFVFLVDSETKSEVLSLNKYSKKWRELKCRLPRQKVTQCNTEWGQCCYFELDEKTKTKFHLSDSAPHCWFLPNMYIWNKNLWYNWLLDLVANIAETKQTKKLCDDCWGIMNHHVHVWLFVKSLLLPTCLYSWTAVLIPVYKHGVKQFLDQRQ